MNVRMMIVAMIAVAMCVASVLAEEFKTIQADQQWQPIENSLMIDAGTVLDFSFLSDGPAGKYGALVVRNGHFAFETRPETPVRLFGPNLCYDLNFPSKADAPKIADLLKRMGYNVVRFHHYDHMLMPTAGGAMDMEKLDRLEYLFACLQERGIYAVIDLHSARMFGGDEVPELPREFCKEIAVLNQISPAGRKAWERFARALLTHRNPYTKRTWAEDPALVGVCPVNEDHTLGGLPVSPLFEKPYAAWLAERGLTVKSEADNAAYYVQFQAQMIQKTYAYYKEFLNSLGVKALMTGANNVEHKVLTLIRQPLDFADNHAYWAHPDCFPEHPWKLPWKQAISISELGRLSGAHRIYGACRIVDKPFTITEFNYCYPNFYRAEGGPLMGAYAAFQNWDGLFRFDFGHDADILHEQRPAYIFGAAYDPINRMTEKMIALLFLRGDVMSAKTTIPYLMNETTASRTFRPEGDYFHDDVRRLSLCVGVGSVDATDVSRVDKKYRKVIVPTIWSEVLPNVRMYRDDGSLVNRLLADGVIDSRRCNLAKDRYRSDTDQIELDGQNRLFRVMTDRSEAFVFEQAGRHVGRRVAVENAGQACTVFVGAVDDQPIETSGRLVVFHLTDVQNDKVKFTSDYSIWQEVGQLPHLVRRGSARIDVKVATPGQMRVWAVDLSGKRVREVAVTRTANSIGFVAETLGAGGACLVYEIDRGVVPAKGQDSGAVR